MREKKTNGSRSINSKLRHRRNWIVGRAGSWEQPPPAGQNPLHCIIMSMVQAENTATSVTAVETEVAENNENKSLPIQYSSIQHFKLEYLIVDD